MSRYAVSSDGVRIHYDVTGTGPTALVFVHGWLGNVAWWNAQRDVFADRYAVVRIDLAGHGASERTRTTWSAQRFADDISAVAQQIDARDIVLVGIRWQVRTCSLHRRPRLAPRQSSSSTR